MISGEVAVAVNAPPRARRARHDPQKPRSLSIGPQRLHFARARGGRSPDVAESQLDASEPDFEVEAGELVAVGLLSPAATAACKITAWPNMPVSQWVPRHCRAWPRSPARPAPLPGQPGPPICSLGRRADGWETPVPFKIDLQHGDEDLEQIARDILGLAKLNCNAHQTW